MNLVCYERGVLVCYERTGLLWTGLWWTWSVPNVLFWVKCWTGHQLKQCQTLAHSMV